MPLFDHLPAAGFAFMDNMPNGYVARKTTHSRIYAKAKKPQPSSTTLIMVEHNALPYDTTMSWHTDDIKATPTSTLSLELTRD